MKAPLQVPYALRETSLSVRSQVMSTSNVKNDDDDDKHNHHPYTHSYPTEVCIDYGETTVSPSAHAPENFHIYWRAYRRPFE